MVEIPDKIKLILNKYLASLNENNIPIQKAVLFGSYANGSYNEWSDIDVALVSNIFEGIRIKDRDKIRRITLAISYQIEVMPYKPEDFTTDDPFVNEILETGIHIV